MKGLVLCGGKGMRMRPLTHTGPKQLIPVANKPIVFYCIEDLVEAGITDIGIIVGYTTERIKLIADSIGDGGQWGAKITYIQQKAPSGIGDAVKCAKDFIKNEKFVVYLGDNLLGEGIKKYIKKFESSNVHAGILLAEVKEACKYGVVTLKDGEIVDVEEKPKVPKSSLVLIGVYFFTSVIFEALDKIAPSWRGEYELTEAIRILVRSEKYIVNAYQVKDWWDDTGTPEDVLHANQMVLSKLKNKIQGNISEDTSITGPVEIGEGSVIKKKCVLRGPIIIGKNCIIGPKTYIGPYTSIGNNVKIVGGEIEYTIIMDGSVIETNKRITDSLIGSETMITLNRNLPNGVKLIVGKNTNIFL